MLLVNGNGVEVNEVGNFVAGVRFDRSVLFTDYYKEQRSFEEVSSYITDNMADSAIDTAYESKRRFSKIFEDTFGESKDDDLLWKEAFDEFHGRYGDVISVDSVPDEEFGNTLSMIDVIKSGKWLPHLSLSPGYYKLDKFTEHTDPFLIELGLSVCEAYRAVMVEILDKPEEAYGDNPVTGGTIEELSVRYHSDVLELSRQIERLKSFL